MVMGITILRVATATNPNNMLATKVGKNCGCRSMNNRDVKITALPSFPFLVNAFNINPRKKSSSEMAAANPTIAIFITHSEKVLAWRSVCIVWIYSLGIGTNCWERLPNWSPITTNERDRGSAITKSIWEGKFNDDIVFKILKERFPLIIGPRKDDICYATQNRQDAVKQLALESDLILVIGSKSSSNSNRLREIAERSGVEAYLIDTAEDLSFNWFKDKNVIGITSGASAPEHLVAELLEKLSENFDIDLKKGEDRQDEGIFFKLPKELRN